MEFTDFAFQNPFSMLDPITTPLLLLVLGRIGEELLTDACKDFLKDKLEHLLSTRGNSCDLELSETSRCR